MDGDPLALAAAQDEQLPWMPGVRRRRRQTGVPGEGPAPYDFSALRIGLAQSAGAGGGGTGNLSVGQLPLMLAALQ